MQVKAPPNRATLHRQWQSHIQALHDPHLELTVEEFAGLLSVYKLLRAAGKRFDPMLVALMAVLERQAADSVDGFEDDTDSDEDASASDEVGGNLTGYNMLAVENYKWPGAGWWNPGVVGIEQARLVEQTARAARRRDQRQQAIANGDDRIGASHAGLVNADEMGKPWMKSQKRGGR